MLRLFVVHIPPVSERLNYTECSSQASGRAQHLAPRIVGIFYNHTTVCVNDPVDAELQSRRLKNNLRKTIDSTRVVIAGLIAVCGSTDITVQGHGPLAHPPYPAIRVR